MKRKEIIIERKDVLEPIFQKMLRTETHHTHEIIQSKNGVLRWKDNIDENDIESESKILRDIESNQDDFYSESMRELYRDLGYSLCGYWKMFYGMVDDENEDGYVPNPPGSNSIK